MKERKGTITASISIVFVIILGVFQIMDWKIPVALAITIISLAAIFLFFIVSRDLWSLVFSFSSRYSLKFVDNDKPNPDQWLLDIAIHDAKYPQGEIKILSRFLTNWNLDPKSLSPFITIGVTLFNGGVHQVIIGSSSGKPFVNNDKLPYEVELTQSISLPGRASDTAFLTVPLLPELSDTIHSEIHKNACVKSINLSSVLLNVVSKPVDGNASNSGTISLSGDNIFKIKN